MSARTNSNSVSEAAGNPTSISLKPARTSVSKNSTFSSRPMGTISAWLPSRRSTEHQMGARSMWSRRAQRMGGFSGAKYWIPYLLAFCMLFSFPAQSREAGEKKSPRLLRVQETKAFPPRYHSCWHVHSVPGSLFPRIGSAVRMRAPG